MTDLESLFNSAITSARQGDRAEARRLLEQLLQRDERNERAWMAMASVVDTPEERRICLENVLEINPDNERARQALSQVTGTPVPSVPRTVRAATASTSASQVASVRNTAHAGEEAGEGTRSAWKQSTAGQKMWNYILIGGIVLILVAFLLPALFPAPPAPAPVVDGFGNTVAPAFTSTTASVAVVINSPIPSATVNSIVVQDVTIDPNRIAASWTPSPTPLPSETPLPTATLPALNIYQIAYVGGQGTDTRIYLAGGDGSGEKVLIDIAGATDPAWSPDGTKLAYIAPQEGKPQLIIANANGSNPQPLTTLTGSQAGTPSWSPDGRQIAFSSNEAGNNDIYLIDVTGQNLVKFTQNPNDDLYPSWSPDGKVLVYSADIAGGGTYQIVHQNIGETGVVAYTSSGGTNTHPSYAPDGSAIVFASTRDGRSKIYVMRPDGSAERLISFGDSGAESTMPAWSPDSTYILYASSRDGVLNLVSMRPDGKDVIQVTKATAPRYAGKYKP